MLLVKSPRPQLLKEADVMRSPGKCWFMVTLLLALNAGGPTPAQEQAAQEQAAQEQAAQEQAAQEQAAQEQAAQEQAAQEQVEQEQVEQAPDGQAGRELGVQTDRPSSGPYVEVDGRFLVPYLERLPGSDETFEMVPIPAGQLRVPSKRGSGLVRVNLRPCWVAKHEVQWGVYAEFSDAHQILRDAQRAGANKIHELSSVDAITAPTMIYSPRYRLEYVTSPKQPAASMSQYGARQYTKWLSLLTDRSYRLMSESEWMYCCLAGDSIEVASKRKLLELAVCGGKTDGPAVVGSLSSNAWGLCDLQGNVAEWVLDHDGRPLDQRLKPGEYTLEASIGKLNSSLVAQVANPTRAEEAAHYQLRYGQLACGGCWDDDPSNCLPLSRKFCDETWWESEANIPLSPCWLANPDFDRGVGFRVLREYPTRKKIDMMPYWSEDSIELADDVLWQVECGRGVRGTVTKTLFSADRPIILGHRVWLRDF